MYLCALTTYRFIESNIPVNYHFKLKKRVKKIVFFLFFVLILTSVQSETPSGYRYVKTWHISDRFAVVDSIPVDTIPLNFQDDNPIDRFSIANSYNGNLGSPIQSKLYFDRPAVNDFIFANAYFPYMMNVQHATFYNTKTPYTNLDYKTGGTNYRDEDHIKFLFTGNANKKLNIGTTLDYIYARGEYKNQGIKRFSASLFGSYNGKHYNASGLITTNNLDNYENGGLSDTLSINPTNIATSDIPANIVGYSNYKQTQIFFNQQYSIGFERPIQVSKDSVGSEYVPVTRFAHTLKFDGLSKRYYENSVEKTFYQNTYFPTLKQTNDTSALQTLSNNFSVSMAEEFNKWMKFGLSAYIENEIQRYTYNQDTLVNNMLQSSTKVGAILSKQQGQIFRYNILGEINLLGYKAGDYLLQGNVGGFFKLWNDSISLVATGFSRRDLPSYFLQHYQSNHFRWDNSFNHVYRTHIGGTFSIPTRSLSLDIGVENIRKYIYFDENALPAQYAGNIQILAANFKKDFHVGKFTLENNIVYQLSSNPSVLTLPDLTLFHNLYYHDKWFDVLTVQIGANLRYHTAYYAPSYMPATGQFYSQMHTKIGNYPVLNAYLNFHLKRTRFFIEYYNISQMFIKEGYYSMPNYPIDPAIMKGGLSWNFYD